MIPFEIIQLISSYDPTIACLSYPLTRVVYSEMIDHAIRNNYVHISMCIIKKYPELIHTEIVQNAFIFSIYEQYFELVFFLIESGIDLTIYQGNVLEIAVSVKNFELVEYLLSRQVDPSLNDNAALWKAVDTKELDLVYLIYSHYKTNTEWNLNDIELLIQS